MYFDVYMCTSWLRESLLSRKMTDVCCRGMEMETLIQHANQKEDKISKIINSVLRQVFGEEATLLIYRYLEAKYSLRPDEVSGKIELFAKGLEEFLRSGAFVVERRILDDIYSSYGLLRRLELEQSHVESDFVSQVRMLMHKA